ncbi:MAG: hypothetical protein NVSMB57_01440 [Actinomycetota bacterium]
MDLSSFSADKHFMQTHLPAKVLVVDDDPVVREVVVAVLDDGECAIEEAESGPAALRSALRSHPDVIVLDVMMPGMTGIEVCRILRQDPSFTGTVVVMLSALDSYSARNESTSAGADAYLTKPFSALDLIGAVSEAVSRVQR